MLYGLAPSGGTGYGSLFEFNPSNYLVTKRVNFNGSVSGSNPRGSLVLAKNGKLYGMTEKGGANNYGVIFEYDPGSNSSVKKYDFSYAKGAYPRGNLVEAPNGKLYGLAYSGGANSTGSLFSYNPGDTGITLLYSFDYHGYFPTGSVTVGADGKLYGLLSADKYIENGATFIYDISLNKTDVYIFPSSLADALDKPSTNYMKASNGLLYGMFQYGGPSGGGYIFSYNPQANSVGKVLNFTGVNGFYPAPNSAMLEVNMSAVSSISEQNKISSITCFPNPFKGRLSIKFEKPSEVVKCTIMDTRGVEVYSSLNPSLEILELETVSWATGIYFIHIETSEGNFFSKIVKE